MKTKLICWLPECVYQYDRSKRLLISENIVPLLDSKYSQDIWEAQGKPDWAMRHISYLPYENDGLVRDDIICYKDEPISTNQYEGQQGAFKLLCKSVNVIIGETCPELIAECVENGAKQITLTSYGWHLFRIFGVNIRMPFTSQLNTWKYLENKYNWQVLYSDKSKQYFSAILPKEEHKFTFTWIMLDQQRHWRKLITWATQHNKTIGIVVPDNKQQDVEWIYKQLTKFINVYKEVVK